MPRRAAQVLVETALVLPLLLVASLGVLQFALYEHARDVLAGAAQEGARLAAEDGRTLDQGYRRVRDLAAAGLGTAIEPFEPAGSRGDEVVLISLDTQLRPILPLPVQGGLPIHVEASVARERFRPGGGGR
jgi:TadE-like protein